MTELHAPPSNKPPSNRLHTVSRWIDPDLMQRALLAWGQASQIDMAQEEFAELIVALSHAKRGRDTNLVEELADAMIMLEQLLHCVNMGLVAKAIVAKQTRLTTRLNQADLARARANDPEAPASPEVMRELFSSIAANLDRNHNPNPNRCPECGCER